MGNPKTQGRMIRKDISNSDKISALSPAAAVLFMMMIPHYNAHGKMNGGPGYIKDEICPKISYLTYKNIPDLLKEISSKTNVKWFEKDGRYWIHSLNFISNHQTLDPLKVGLDLLPTYSGLTHEIVIHKDEVEVEVEVEVEAKAQGRVAPDFVGIVEDLNSKTGKQYKPTSKTTRDRIQARWNDGFRLPDFQKVHSVMAGKWLNDQKMQQFLRPETLYGPKFESYLNSNSNGGKSRAEQIYDTMAESRIPESNGTNAVGGNRFDKPRSDNKPSLGEIRGEILDGEAVTNTEMEVDVCGE